MSEHLGPRTFGEKEDLIFLGREITEQRDYSEKVAEKIDEEIFSFITRATKMANEIIDKERSKLELIVKELLKKETIEKEKFESLLEDKDKKIDGDQVSKD